MKEILMVDGISGLTWRPNRISFRQSCLFLHPNGWVVMLEIQQRWYKSIVFYCTSFACMLNTMQSGTTSTSLRMDYGVTKRRIALMQLISLLIIGNAMTSAPTHLHLNVDHRHLDEVGLSTTLQALNDFKKSIIADPMHVLDTWDTTNVSGDPCDSSWIGLGCNSQGHVTSISLSNLSLQMGLGGFPDTLSLLSSLSSLDLSYNNLSFSLNSSSFSSSSSSLPAEVPYPFSSFPLSFCRRSSHLHSY